MTNIRYDIWFKVLGVNKRVFSSKIRRTRPKGGHQQDNRTNLCGFFNLDTIRKVVVPCAPMCAKQPGWRIYFPAPALQNISSGESFSWSSQRFTEACIEHNHARIHTFRKHNYTFVEAEHLKDNRYCRIAPKTVQGLKYNVAKLLSRYYSHSKKKTFNQVLPCK